MLTEEVDEQRVFEKHETPDQAEEVENQEPIAEERDPGEDGVAEGVFLYSRGFRFMGRLQGSFRAV